MALDSDFTAIVATGTNVSAFATQLKAAMDSLASWNRHKEIIAGSPAEPADVISALILADSTRPDATRVGNTGGLFVIQRNTAAIGATPVWVTVFSLASAPTRVDPSGNRRRSATSLVSRLRTVGSACAGLSPCPYPTTMSVP